MPKLAAMTVLLLYIVKLKVTDGDKINQISKYMLVSFWSVMVQHACGMSTLSRELVLGGMKSWKIMNIGRKMKVQNRRQNSM